MSFNGVDAVADRPVGIISAAAIETGVVTFSFNDDKTACLC